MILECKTVSPWSFSNLSSHQVVLESLVPATQSASRQNSIPAELRQWAYPLTQTGRFKVSCQSQCTIHKIIQQWQDMCPVWCPVSRVMTATTSGAGTEGSFVASFEDMGSVLATPHRRTRSHRHWGTNVPLTCNTCNTPTFSNAWCWQRATDCFGQIDVSRCVQTRSRYESSKSWDFIGRAILWKILCRFQWDRVHFAELAPQILGDLFEDAVTLQLVEAWIRYDQMAWRHPEIWKIWESYIVHPCTALSMDRRWNKFDVVWVFRVFSQVTPDPWDLLISRRAKANPQGKEEVRHETSTAHWNHCSLLSTTTHSFCFCRCPTLSLSCNWFQKCKTTSR